MAVSTHREYLSDCSFSSTAWHRGVPRACPAGQDGPGSGERDCRDKGDSKRGDPFGSFSYTLAHCIGKLTCTRKRHMKKEECKLPLRFTNEKGEARQTMPL